MEGGANVPEQSAAPGVSAIELQCTLLALPDDAHTRVLGHLTAKELARCKCVSSRLGAVADQDHLWQPLVQHWLAEQGVEPGPHLGVRVTPPKLLRAFRLGSYQQLCRELHLLGHWPVGLYRTDGRRRGGAFAVALWAARSDADLGSISGSRGSSSSSRDVPGGTLGAGEVMGKLGPCFLMGQLPLDPVDGEVRVLEAELVSDAA